MWLGTAWQSSIIPAKLVLQQSSPSFAGIALSGAETRLVACFALLAVAASRQAAVAVGATFVALPTVLLVPCST